MSKFNFIVRDKQNPTKQMQITVGSECGEEPTIGIVCNNGLELLMISQTISGEIPLKFTEGEPK